MQGGPHHPSAHCKIDVPVDMRPVQGMQEFYCKEGNSTGSARILGGGPLEQLQFLHPYFTLLFHLPSYTIYEAAPTVASSNALHIPTIGCSAE